MKDKLDPRQLDFIKFYIDNGSETYGNAFKSAKKAGYAQEYAENITNLAPKWLSDFMGKRQRLLNKAEKRLEDSIESKDERVGLDASKFTLSRLDKKNYADRMEHTGEEGIPITTIKYIIPNDNKADKKTTSGVGSSKE